jgi:levanase
MSRFMTRRRVLGLIGSASLLQSSARRLFSQVLAGIGSRVPRFHAATATGRINDPQRPLWINGCWNLWILWNKDFPDGRGTVWLRFTSNDLVHWAEAGTSIPKNTTPYGDVWTGSSVVDGANTAGFGRDTVVALMTMPCKPMGGQGTGRWYSNDGGASFQFDSVVMTNPRAEDSNLRDKVFRDPNVRWHEPSQSWVMCLAEPGQIGFYRSSDLKSWKFSGSLKNAELGTLECPNLFTLHLHDPDGKITGEKWVLLCGANGTTKGFTTGTHYWVGVFDGHTFQPDEGTGRWLDGGPDFYAATAFSANSVNPLERTFVIAWMNNWNYADAVQQKGYIGQLSLVRELHLQLVDGTAILQNRPVESVRSLSGAHILGKQQTISDKHDYFWPKGAAQTCCCIDLTMSPVNGSWPEAISLLLRGGDGYSTQLSFNPVSGVAFFDREQCGPIPKVGDAWKARRSVLCNYSKSVSVTIFLDVGSIEVFLNNGESTISALLTAPVDATALRLTATGGQVSISKVKIKQIGGTPNGERTESSAIS